MPDRDQPTPAEAPSVSEALAKLDDEFILCRDFGHTWRPFTARWLDDPGYYEQQLRCNRCKTIRLRHIGRYGQNVDSAYTYADGYQLKGYGRLSAADRDEIRLASITQSISKRKAK